MPSVTMYSCIFWYTFFHIHPSTLYQKLFFLLFLSLSLSLFLCLPLFIIDHGNNECTFYKNGCRMLNIQLFSNFQKLQGRTSQGLHFLLKQLFHIQPLRGRKMEWRTCFRYPCVILPISLRYPSVILPSSLRVRMDDGWTTEG